MALLEALQLIELLVETRVALRLVLAAQGLQLLAGVLHGGRQQGLQSTGVALLATVAEGGEAEVLLQGGEVAAGDHLAALHLHGAPGLDVHMAAAVGEAAVDQHPVFVGSQLLGQAQHRRGVAAEGVEARSASHSITGCSGHR